MANEQKHAHPRWLSTIANIVADIEDEGDRMYFGSTNDADELRAVHAALEMAGVPERFFRRPDFHKHNAELQAAIEALTAQLAERDAEIAALREALHEIDIEASNTIRPDGAEAAFAALFRITQLINPFRRNVITSSE